MLSLNGPGFDPQQKSWEGGKSLEFKYNLQREKLCAYKSISLKTRPGLAIEPSVTQPLSLAFHELGLLACATIPGFSNIFSGQGIEPRASHTMKALYL